MGMWSGSAEISGFLHCVHGGIGLWRMELRWILGCFCLLFLIPRRGCFWLVDIARELPRGASQ